MHCDEAPCIAACPIEGAIYKRDDGLVIIDPEKCTGCRNCVDACPYDAIYFNEDLNLAQKCTGCAHLLDGGEWKSPAAPTPAPPRPSSSARRASSPTSIAKAEVLKPELGAKPRVYYLNIPKKFIAGTVYDPVAKEVVIGATCTLTGSGRREPTRRRPTPSATSGSTAWPTAPTTADHRGQGLRRPRPSTTSARRRTSTWATYRCPDRRLAGESGRRETTRAACHEDPVRGKEDIRT